MHIYDNADRLERDKFVIDADGTKYRIGDRVTVNGEGRLRYKRKLTGQVVGMPSSSTAPYLYVRWDKPGSGDMVSADLRHIRKEG